MKAIIEVRAFLKKEHPLTFASTADKDYILPGYEGLYMRYKTGNFAPELWFATMKTGEYDLIRLATPPKTTIDTVEWQDD